MYIMCMGNCMTELQNLCFSPTSDGSAAAILCSEEFVKKHNLQNQAVEIVSMEMGTDFPSTFKENSCMKMVTYYRRRQCHSKVKIKHK